MNRLEKKCFITAAAAHGLLFVILIIGPAFFVPLEKTDSFKQITVFSAADISKAMSSGGTPQPVQAVPLPPPPTPTPEPPKPQETPTPPEITKPTKPEPKDFEPTKPVVKIKPEEHGDEPVPVKKKRETKLNPEDLMPTKQDKNKQKNDADAARQAREAAEAREAKRLAAEAKEIGNTIKSLDKNLSGKTLVKMPVGVGGGGEASINYRDLIASKYYNAWNPSFSLNEETPDVTVSITITRDGSVTGHITKRSGNSAMDKSVQNALDTVTFIEPFPPSFTEQEMTIPIRFNLRVKRQ
jgi:TonB family protein